MKEYEDIIHLPHHVSATRPQMTMMDRAAQFSPFAALTGYDTAIEETGRLTEEKIELDEYELEELNRRLQEIKSHRGGGTPVKITYFVPDRKKSGGSYQSVAGVVKKIDEFQNILIMQGGRKIPISDILSIE